MRFFYPLNFIAVEVYGMEMNAEAILRMHGIRHGMGGGGTGFPYSKTVILIKTILPLRTYEWYT